MRTQTGFSGWLIVGGFLFAVMVGAVTRASNEHNAVRTHKEVILAQIRARTTPSWAFRAWAERPAFTAVAAPRH